MGLAKDAILAASESKWLRDRAPRSWFMRRSVARFLPGEKVEDAMSAASALAKNHIGALLTQLGESVTDRAEAQSVTGQYLELIDRIRAAGLPAEISVKLTQLGLDVDREFCFANLSKLVEHSPADKTVWIDMEHSPYVDVTLSLYHRARKTHSNVGVCVQAYLYRTTKDLEDLISEGAAVRLVKGAYNEPAEIAYPRKRDVDESYLSLAQRLLGSDARRAGVRAVIATHDVNLIPRIAGWCKSQAIPNGQIEFAMLYGIQRGEQLRLAREGYRCVVLVSYGTFWFPWFMRRLAERPANLFFLARHIFSREKSLG